MWIHKNSFENVIILGTSYNITVLSKHSPPPPPVCDCIESKPVNAHTEASTAKVHKHFYICNMKEKTGNVFNIIY